MMPGIIWPTKGIEVAFFHGLQYGFDPVRMSFGIIIQKS